MLPSEIFSKYNIPECIRGSALAGLEQVVHDPEPSGRGHAQEALQRRKLVLVEHITDVPEKIVFHIEMRVIQVGVMPGNRCPGGYSFIKAGIELTEPFFLQGPVR